MRICLAGILHICYSPCGSDNTILTEMKIQIHRKQTENRQHTACTFGADMWCDGKTSHSRVALGGVKTLIALAR